MIKRLEIKIRAEYSGGMGWNYEAEFTEQEASCFLHLLSCMLFGTKEDIMAARMAWDMLAGKSYTQIARDLNVTKKTLWLWRKFFEFGSEVPQQPVRLRL